MALADTAMTAYQRTFDLLRFQKDRFDLDICVAGRARTAATNGSAAGPNPPAGPEPPSGDPRGWRAYSTADCIQEVDAWSERLLARGIERGDRIALGGPNRPSWLFLDLAIQQVGAITVPVQARPVADELRFVLESTGARLAFFGGPRLLEPARALRSSLPGLEAVLELRETGEPDGSGHPLPLDLPGRRAGSHGALERRRDAVTPDDIATIIFTSGTTGTPKGAVLTHRNLVSNVRAITRAVPLPPRRRALSFLPLAHSFERLVVYGYLASGIPVYFLGALDELGSELGSVGPHYFAAVPRLLERLYEALQGRGRSRRGLRRLVFERALAFGLAYDESTRSTWRRWAEHALARRVLFRPWRRALGGELEAILSGGAPLEPGLSRLFSAAGMTVIEGYGLTETSTFVTANGLSVDERRFGTVGRPVPGVEVRLSPDGEILVRGPNVMRGYLDRPDLTAEAIDGDGWFHTGDLGVLDADGFLSITGRKKDLFKLSGGEYVAPEPLESHYRRSPLIEQVMIVGAGRKHIAALIVPAFGELAERCRQSGATARTREELVGTPAARSLVAEELHRLGEGLPRARRIERFEVLPDQWSTEGGQLGATLKIKRHVVAERYADAIRRCFDEAAATTSGRS